jgi:cobalt-precorrin 5A hydrolase / cobalt-factor III methyltransferase / precorrin-3B C17-methyltransferase
VSAGRAPEEVPQGVAIVALSPSAAPLAHRIRALLAGARVHGPRARPADWDEGYERALPHIARLFAARTPILGLCASGILIRAVAPLLADKRAEPPVVALSEEGRVAVPLLGAHRGGNALARYLAAALGGTAAITSAQDLFLGFALDAPPPGWRVANPERAKDIASALLGGERVSLVEEAGGADWLKRGGVAWAKEAAAQVIVTDRAKTESEALVLHPPVLALGVGCEKGCPADEIEALALSALAGEGLAPAAVAAVASIDNKLSEPGIHALAGALGVPARFFSAARLLEETPRLSERSPAAFAATQCWGVAEGAALAACGEDGVLVSAKRKSRRATCAVARAPAPIDALRVGRAQGALAVVGIGPGDPNWRSPEASAAIERSSDIVGLPLYLDLLGPAIAGKRRHESPIGEEEKRARLALDLASKGRRVALVSSGDAGIYGLAALVFELLDRAPQAGWSSVAVTVCPGISALQAASARAGAPLGEDFCAISLSDLLVPWERIALRLEAAAKADFAVALYNPASRGRPHPLERAARILLRHRHEETPVFIARNLGRPGESCRVLRLAALLDAKADMLSLVIIGNSRTRVLAGDPLRLYTPRGYFDRPPK